MSDLLGWRWDWQEGPVETEKMGQARREEEYGRKRERLNATFGALGVFDSVSIPL